MKNAIIAVAFCAFIAVASATGTSMQLEALLKMQTEASGAIDTVLNLLQDLKKASDNEKAQVEARNKTQEKDGQKLIADLTGLLNLAQKNLDDASAHRLYVEKEINDTEAHIQWIHNRVAEIKRKLKVLKKQRCKANHIMIDQIREHIDALRAIKTLQDEITRLHAAGELAEVSSITDKLQAYGHLFEKNTIDKFLELGSEKGVYDITGHVDNKKGELKLDRMAKRDNIKGSLADKVVQMLKGLATHLSESIQDLQRSEIQAAYDYAEFKSNSHIENITLHQDLVTKEKYAAKLDIDLEVAIQNEDSVTILRDEAQLNLDAAVTDLETKRGFYAHEIARINEDVATLDQVITIFRDKVASLQGNLQARIDEEQAGDKMTRKMNRKASGFERPVETVKNAKKQADAAKGKK